MTAPVVFRDGRYNGRTAREWLPDVVSALVEAADPLKIVLFGSFTDGSEGPDSDLDLLVVLPRVEDKIETMLWLRQVTAHIPVPLDLLPTDLDEIDRRGEEIGNVLRPALQQGRILYERPA